jgi:hypothetical protein
MPIPESRTVTTTLSPSSAADRLMRPACPEYLAALFRRLERICAARVLSALIWIGDFGQFQRERVAARFDQGTGYFERTAHYFRQSHRLQVQINPAGGNPRDVDQVVESARPSG